MPRRAGATGRARVIGGLAAALLAVGPAAAALSGCSTGARGVGVGSTPAVSRPPRAVASTSPTPPVPPITVPSRATSPSPSAFPEAYAVSCGGRPDGGTVVALLRRKGMVGSGTQAVAQTGPLCAGTWQYTVVTVAGAGPLQVVTQGTPTSLELVTAGTDVCSVQVRALAPAGIVSAAHCSG